MKAQPTEGEAEPRIDQSIRDEIRLSVASAPAIRTDRDADNWEPDPRLTMRGTFPMSDDPMSDGAVRVSGPVNAAGLEMTLETGKLAQLAAGAVVVKVGETTVLSTVTT